MPTPCFNGKRYSIYCQKSTNYKRSRSFSYKSNTSWRIKSRKSGLSPVVPTAEVPNEELKKDGKLTDETECKELTDAQINKIIDDFANACEISLKAGSRSVVIQTLLEINPDSNEIPLIKIKSNIVKKVKEYLEHYENIEPKEIERPLRSNNFKECVDEWDYNFMNVELDEMLEILLASNYMNIKPLLELSSAKQASIIKGKTIEEINKLYNLENDFTPEEEQQILEENKWCLENL